MFSSKTFDRDGFTVTVRTEPDDDLNMLAEPDEDCGQAVIDAFKRGDWCYAQLRVSVALDDVTLAVDYLGAVADGWIPSDAEGDPTDREDMYDAVDHLDDFEDFIIEAIENAKDRLHQLVQTSAELDAAERERIVDLRKSKGA